MCRTRKNPLDLWNWFQFLIPQLRWLLIPFFMAGCGHSSLKERDKNPSVDPLPHVDYQLSHGAIIRGDTTGKQIALVFTGDEYADGGWHILSVLERQQVSGSFFLTGKFYRNPQYESLIKRLVASRHYMGAHSDQHLLYCDWEQRDSLLVSQRTFNQDLESNYCAMWQYGISKENARFFLPPFEWYNDAIAAWTSSMDLQLVNFSPGTLSHADYTLPASPGYRRSKEIYNSILEFEQSSSNGLNGFILLSHIGTAPERTDKFYFLLDSLISELLERGYEFETIDQLLALEY